jgi:hypothetical protein
LRRFLSLQILIFRNSLKAALKNGVPSELFFGSLKFFFISIRPLRAAAAVTGVKPGYVNFAGKVS